MDELLDRAFGDRELARDMANMFIAGITICLESISNALATGDSAALTRSAHKLKGSAATIALSSLSAVALKIESLAEAGDLESVGQLLPELEEQIEQGVEALRNMLVTL